MASSFKDVLLPCLLLVVGALTITCGWQRVELRRLAAAQKNLAAEKLPTFRAARAQTFVVNSLTGSATARSIPTRDDGGEFVDNAPPTGARNQNRATPESTLAQLLSNPEFFQALQLHRQASLDSRFAPLFRQLGLTGENLAAFKRLLAEKENAALDVIAVSESQPEGPLSASMLGASVNAARAHVDEAIRNTLGAERYALYSDYEKSLPQRAIVAQLEQRLSYTAAPLTPTQSAALVRILASSSAPAAAETIPAMSVVVRAGVPEAVPIPPTSAATGRVTENVVAQAQTVLTPAQLTALREIQTEQQAAITAANLIRSATAGNDQTPSYGLTLLLQ